MHTGYAPENVSSLSAISLRNAAGAPDQ